MLYYNSDREERERRCSKDRHASPSLTPFRRSPPFFASLYYLARSRFACSQISRIAPFYLSHCCLPQEKRAFTRSLLDPRGVNCLHFLITHTLSLSFLQATCVIDEIATFPRHLFSPPVSTSYTVSRRRACVSHPPKRILKQYFPFVHCRSALYKLAFSSFVHCLFAL